MFRPMSCLAIFGLISLLTFAQSTDKPALTGPDSKPSASDTPPGLSPLAEALESYRMGDFSHAIAKYKEILQEKPTSPDGWAGLIRSYLKLRDVDSAAKSAEQALSALDHPRIRTARAEVLFRQGKITEADKEWVNVVNSGYPESRAYLGLARVRRANSMYHSEAELIRKAHEWNPDDPDIKALWLTTLPQSQLIEQLRSLLAERTSLDEDQRTKLSRLLDSAVQWRNDHSCRLVSKAKAMETPLMPASKSFRHTPGYRLPVTVNSSEESLLLDTGASGIVLGREVAENSGIKQLFRTMLSGIGGTGRTSGSIGFAESVKIGEMEFRNCPVKVTDDPFVVGESGLIGTDVFQKFLVEIDFPNEKLKLSELPQRPGERQEELSLSSSDEQESERDRLGESVAQDRYIAPDMQSFTRVYRFGHLLLTAASIGDTPPKLFMLDTGAMNNLISLAAAEEVTKVHRRSNLLMEGVAGEVRDVYTAKKVMIRFGRFAEQNQEIVGFDTKAQSDNAGTEISGFLGFQTLRMLDITIDYRDGLVNFGYDAEKWNEIKHRH
jgi:tetratricopeptide (TPR) repeat protein